MSNIVSVSWGDHLSFGDGEGRLDTPEKLRRRMPVWRDELGAGSLHWRMLRSRIPGTYAAAQGYRHPSESSARGIGWDDFTILPALAREAGLSPWLYVTVFDEGWQLAPEPVRRVSYHNEMHGQHVAWQSILTRDHPQWLVTDRAGRERQEGVVSLAYLEARRAFIERWTSLIAPTEFDGLFVCLRSQSRPADTADQFGFNEPARRDFLEQHGVDVTRDPFDIQAWRNLLGLYLTALFSDLRRALGRLGKRLAVGCARGDVLGPPLGNTTLSWRDWVRLGLIDRLVIDQSSSQCPSMWHQLWPMHRGTGTCRTIWTEPECLHSRTSCPRRTRPCSQAAQRSCSWRGSGANPRATMTPACPLFPVSPDSSTARFASTTRTRSGAATGGPESSTRYVGSAFRRTSYVASAFRRTFQSAAIPRIARRGPT